MTWHLTKSRISENLIYLPLFWIATAMFWLERGDKILLIIVVVCALISLCINKTQIIKSNWQSNPWLKWILLLIAFGMLSNAIHGFGSRELRALETSVILLLFLDANKVNIKCLAMLILLGSISALGVTYYYQFIEYTDRRIWPVNAIPFASYITLLIGLGATLLKYSPSRLHSFVLSSATIIGLLALLLTESRGPLLALICTFGILFFYSLLKRKIRWKLIISLLLLGGAVLSLSYPIIKERTQQTIADISRIQQGNFNTSIGARLTVYKIGLDMIAEKPLLGYGKADLSSRWDHMLKNKEINGLVHKVLSWNFHNNFIEKGVASGLVGIATMFLWLGIPIVYAWRHFREEFPLIATPPLLYLFACFTDTPATNGSSYVTYLIFVGLILSHMYKQTDKLSFKERTLA